MKSRARTFNPVEMLHTDEEIAQWLVEVFENEKKEIREAVVIRVAQHIVASVKCTESAVLNK